ncbi:MAG: hypothetical protein QOJ66_958 [Ilumatobacteraceae bacterium]
MRWATRRHCHVDRAACAWLIRNHIDRDSVFVFVDDPDEVPDDATAFDMRGVELGHHGDKCSFETILEHFDLDDPVLWDVGRIVHEADLGDERFDAPEAVGLDVICRGLSMIHDDDEALLEITAAIFDALYEHRRRALLLGRDPA